jgi:stearoyl-CoA desaturase (delta-9 desaturase)
MGWLLCKKHPDVIKKGSQIPMNDLLEDKVVYIQKKYYKILAIVFCFVLPTLVPYYLWNESLSISYFVAIIRYVFTLHVTWLVNSLAHWIGYKPYDKRISPVENLFVAIGAIGEGFHNFHHSFPRDYSTSEYGSVYFNFTKGFIDFMALLGQVYDRNKTSAETVMHRRLKHGDLSNNDSSLNLHEHDY